MTIFNGLQLPGLGRDLTNYLLVCRVFLYYSCTVLISSMEELGIGNSVKCHPGLFCGGFLWIVVFPRGRVSEQCSARGTEGC